MPKKKKYKSEERLKETILSELKIADEMRKASKQLLGTNTARPEVLRRAKRYARLGKELTMRSEANLQRLKKQQKIRNMYNKKYGDM